MRRRVLACVALGTVLAATGPGLAAAPVEEVAVIRTRHGQIAFRFLDDAAPQHVSYVKELIRRGFYDGTTFHRVIPHFVIQGGDPNSKDTDRSNDGEGEGDRRLPAEFSRTVHYRPGTVGMARDVDPDSGSCQFFIALENLPRLDGRYTVFGEVISGLEVARKIAGLPRDLRDNPLERVELKVGLRRSRVAPRAAPVAPGESGEVLTGPEKPKPWDPGDVRWKAPSLSRPAGKPLGTEAWASTSLDLSIDGEGRVLDVRFGPVETDHAPEVLAAVRRWSFSPAAFDGRPVKARFSVDSHGKNLAPSQAPGTPVETGGDVTPPGAAVPVTLPAGTKRPEKEPLLRLTVDESGRVADVSLQSSCGDGALDGAAIEAARRVVFVPARRGRDVVPVYVNLPGKFVESQAP